MKLEKTKVITNLTQLKLKLKCELSLAMTYSLSEFDAECVLAVGSSLFLRFSYKITDFVV